MLHRHGTHAEAVARVGWWVTERAALIPQTVDLLAAEDPSPSSTNASRCATPSPE
jgi:hypothetical protein